jgi:hypothetical protein
MIWATRLSLIEPFTSGETPESLALAGARGGVIVATVAIDAPLPSPPAVLAGTA